MKKQNNLLKMNICYLRMYLIFDQLHKCKIHIYTMINMHTDQKDRILNVVNSLVTLF